MQFSTSLPLILLASMLPTATTAFVTDTNIFLEKGTVQHWQHQIGDNGAVDLHDLDFSTHEEGSGSGSTVLDIAIFPLPSECGDSFHGCDTSSVGVGIHGDDDNGLVNYCCMPEMVDANKCDTPGRLLLAKSTSASMPNLFSGSLVTLDIPSRGTLEAAIFEHATIVLPKTGVHAVLIANCNQELGRTLHITGSIEWIRHQDHPADTSTSTSGGSGQESPSTSNGGHAAPSVDAVPEKGQAKETLTKKMQPTKEENKNVWPFFLIGFVGLAVIAIYSWRQYQSAEYDHYMNQDLHQLVVAEDGDEHFYDLESPGASMPTATTRRNNNNNNEGKKATISTDRRASFRPETTLSTDL